MHTAATVESATRVLITNPLVPRPDVREDWVVHNVPVPFDTAARLVLAAHRSDGERRDIVTADLRTWAFGTSTGTSAELAELPLLGREPREPLLLRELAFSQLCTKLGVPTGYVRDLPAKLQVANLNYALSRHDEPAMFRLAGNQVRAIVSERYSAVDDHVLLELVSESLDRAGLRNEAMVRATAVGTHTLLRVTLPNEGVAVKQGDVIEHGIDLGNSELGLRSVQVTPVTFRLVCTNGARAWQSEGGARFRHIGDPARLRELLRDAIPVALAEARGDLGRWRTAVDRYIDDALAEVEALRAFGVAGHDAKDVAKALASELQVLPKSTAPEEVAAAITKRRASVFEVANAITATARSRGTAARLTLEEAGHRYLARRTA